MSNILIHFIDEPSSTPIQVPSTISLPHLHAIIGHTMPLYIHSLPITSSLEQTLRQLQIHTSEHIIPITSKVAHSKVATFCSASFSGHTAAVLAIKIYKNQVISASGDKTIRIWDNITKTTEFIIKNSDHWNLAVDCDEQKIVAASLDGNVCVYDWNYNIIGKWVMHKKGTTHVKVFNIFVVSAGKDGAVCVSNLCGMSIMSYVHDGPVDSLAVYCEKTQEDSKNIINENESKSNIIDSYIIDKSIIDKSIIDNNDKFNDRPSHHKIKNNDTYIVSSGRDCKIKIYKNIKFYKELKNHSKRINTLKINNKIMVSGSDDCRVLIYDVMNDFKVLKELKHKHVVCGVDISENNLYVASCSFDMTVKLWDVRTGNLLGSYFHVSSVYGVKFWKNLLISYGKDKVIKTYCTFKKTVVSEMLCGDEVFDVDINDNAMVAACRDGRVYFFN